MKTSAKKSGVAAAKPLTAWRIRGDVWGACFFRNRVKTRAGKVPGVCLWLLLAVVALGASGCELAYLLKGPDNIKARHTLLEHKTLVIVDDPTGKLGNPNLAAVVGANVGHHLTANQALPQDAIIPQNRLTELAVSLGEDYLTTPIDRVGQRLGARQVVYVLIRSVNMRVVANYYRPTVVVEVKLIDVDTGKRLFPDPGDYPNIQATPPGMILTVQMRHRTLDEGRRDAESLLARRLAERIGLDVAQIFYDHEKPKPAQGD